MKFVKYIKTWQFILGIVMIILGIIFANGTSFYKSNIGVVKSYNTTKADKEYKQTLTIKVLNHKYRGQNITATNEYTFSGALNEKIHKGDQVFLSISKSGDSFSASISGVRRDYYAFWLVLILLYIVVVMAKVRGIRALISVVLNIVIFAVALHFYTLGHDLFSISIVLMFVFTICSMLISNKVKTSSFISIISTLITSFLVLLLVKWVFKIGVDIDYANLDYITGKADPEMIFMASLNIASLGAVMDVAISITSSLFEVIRKNPNVKSKNLISSGREIGYDIMGSMTSVLFFTYAAGLIPLMIIKMHNDVSMITILHLQVPFEICRFLIGGIAIVLAIPVTIFICGIYFKVRNKK
ncbi:MAG: YibE/F family protein [Lachnospiraceae bacterium]|jgi:uncharacterized membrane protein|nr:YibE/F family protein [Lachnospiraceae bacterium]